MFLMVNDLLTVFRVIVGEHKITVTYGGIKAGASPYTAKAFDVNAVKVGEIPDGVIGKPVTFSGEK